MKDAGVKINFTVWCDKQLHAQTQHGTFAMGMTLEKKKVKLLLGHSSDSVSGKYDFNFGPK